VLVQERRDAGEPMLLTVVPQARVRRADPVLGVHRGGLGEDQARAAHRWCGLVREMPVA
jgi:hypothetical protein